MCCPTGSSDIPEVVNQFMKNDSVKKKTMLYSKLMGPIHPTWHHLSEDYSLQQHCCQNTNLILKLPIKKYSFKLPYGMSSCMWKCICTLIQKIQFCCPCALFKIGCVIKGLHSIQLEMLPITRRNLCPQP